MKGIKGLIKVAAGVSLAAVYCNNHWYWYSSTTQDVLFECGEYKDMLIDDAIEITAWMPFPEPYKEENGDDYTE